MPHQCLGCGEVFADGSTDLLKGCPACAGTRFFFTVSPLDDDARADLAERTETDVRSMLEQVLKSGEKRDLNADIWGREAWERWVRLERGGQGKDAPALTPLAQPPGAAAPRRIVQVSLEHVEEAAPLETARPAAADVAPATPEARPSTLQIVEPGKYEIDVQRLMDDGPVIVERDGSYVIHLPSVFARAGGKRRR